MISLQLSPCSIVCNCWLSLLCIHPHVQMWMATFIKEDSASIVALNGSPCGRREDRVGTPSESSHIATGPTKRKMLFQLCSARKNSNFVCSIMILKCVIRHLRVIILWHIIVSTGVKWLIRKSHEHHMRVHQSELVFRAAMNVSQAWIEEWPIWVCQWSLCACEELLTMLLEAGVKRAHQKSIWHDYCLSAL